jgi:DNA-binding CsgD family transcriptional regulator
VSQAHEVTPYEARVWGLIATGMTDPEIAEALGIKVATAKTHAYRLYSKLGVRNRTEAAIAHLKGA